MAVTLDEPSPIALSLYTVSGELVYQATVQGNAGTNVITWNLVNRAGQPVASGLYVFELVIPDGFPDSPVSGQVAVIH